MKKLVFAALLMLSVMGVSAQQRQVPVNGNVSLFDSNSVEVLRVTNGKLSVIDTMSAIKTLLTEWQWAKRERGLYMHEMNAAATVIQCVSPGGVVTDTAAFRKAYDRLIKIANRRAGK